MRCLIVLSLPGVLAAPAAQTQPAPTQLFCVDNLNVIAAEDLAGQGLQLADPPDGAKWIDGAGLILWTPTADRCGEHRLALVNAERQVVRRFAVRVKPLERALFVFAHGDDEFGIMGRLKRLTDAGVQTWCVWTSGNEQTRRDESTRAMEKLGIPASRLMFLRGRNVSRPAGLKQAIDTLARLIEKQDFDQIYTDAYEGGHPQHDLTHVAAVQAARRKNFAGQLYEFGLYNTFGGRVNLFTLVPASRPRVQLSLSRAELQTCLALVPLYASQKHVTQGFLVGMSEQKKRHPTFRPLPRWDYTRRPYPGRMMCELNPRNRGKSYDQMVLQTVETLDLPPQEETTVYEQDRPAAARVIHGMIVKPPQPAGTP